MKLWFCEHPRYSDGACGVFLSFAAAKEHQKECRCYVYEMKRDGAGLIGIVGETVRQTKQRILDAAARGEHPYKGCHGLSFAADEGFSQRRHTTTPEQLADIVRSLDRTPSVQ